MSDDTGEINGHLRTSGSVGKVKPDDIIQYNPGQLAIRNSHGSYVSAIIVCFGRSGFKPQGDAGDEIG